MTPIWTDSDTIFFALIVAVYIILSVTIKKIIRAIKYGDLENDD
jgi:hypothetical protein